MVCFRDCGWVMLDLKPGSVTCSFMSLDESLMFSGGRLICCLFLSEQVVLIIGLTYSSCD